MAKILNNKQLIFLKLSKVRVAVNKFIDEINKSSTKIIDRLFLKL